LIGLRDRPSHSYVCRSKLASNTTDPECEEAHFSRSISIATQTQTLFFPFAVSLASGCSMVYDQGGILPVEINPQIESSLARRWRAELLVHLEKFNSSLPLRTWLWIHHESGATWLYHGHSVWFEWQFPQA